MSKITNLMRRAAVISGVTGALIIGATATAHAAEPTALAPAAVSSTDMPQAAQNEDPITTQSAEACLDYLRDWGYTITATRRGICSLASLPFPAQPTRIAVCTAALLSTGVGTVVSPIACTLATAP